MKACTWCSRAGPRQPHGGCGGTTARSGTCHSASSAAAHRSAARRSSAGNAKAAARPARAHQVRPRVHVQPGECQLEAGQQLPVDARRPRLAPLRQLIQVLRHGAAGGRDVRHCLLRLLRLLRVGAGCRCRRCCCRRRCRQLPQVLVPRLLLKVRRAAAAVAAALTSGEPPAPPRRRPPTWRASCGASAGRRPAPLPAPVCAACRQTPEAPPPAGQLLRRRSRCAPRVSPLDTLFQGPRPAPAAARNPKTSQPPTSSHLHSAAQDLREQCVHLLPCQQHSSRAPDPSACVVV